MLGSLFEGLEAPPLEEAPRRVKLRERRHECSEFIRKVKGDMFQLRPWIEAASGGSMNCGLYKSEWEAERVRERLKRECQRVPGRGKTALSLWAAMKPLIEEGVMPSHLLPKYVIAVVGGFAARVKMGKLPCRRLIKCLGPFATPEEAHLAMITRLCLEFPRRFGVRVAERRITLADYLAAA